MRIEQRKNAKNSCSGAASASSAPAYPSLLNRRLAASASRPGSWSTTSRMVMCGRPAIADRYVSSSRSMASRLARRRCPRHSNFGSFAPLSVLRVGTTSGGLPVPRSHKFAEALACARGTCPRSRSMASRLARRRCLRHSDFGSSAPLSVSLAGTTSGDLPVARSHKFAAALACAPCFFKTECEGVVPASLKQRFSLAFW